MTPSPALRIASNRLPVEAVRTQAGTWELRPSVGGLVSALTPLLRDRGGCWTGWCGRADTGGAALRRALGRFDPAFRMEPVHLTEDEVDGYYLGWSNRRLWPVLHGLPRLADASRDDRATYARVNRAFADALARDGEGPLWIHDYHLLLVAAELRSRGWSAPLGFFLHTPFPTLADLRHVPGWPELVRSMAACDVVAFQTPDDREHFLDAADAAGPEEATDGGAGGAPSIPLGRRARVLPVPVDAEAWSRRALEPRIVRRARAIRQELGVERLVLGVDRLDYIKGLEEKLRGLDRVFERHPSLRGRLTLLQLVTPSRTAIPAYARLRRDLEAQVEALQRRWGTREWSPVRWEEGRWGPDELAAHYRAADALLVTSVRDGMNLVAKEYCASKPDASGVLVLSRFAGAVRQLGDQALLVDPGDPDDVAETLHRGLALPSLEARGRMLWLRRTLRHADLRSWAASMSEALAGSARPDPPSRRPPPRRSRPRRRGSRRRGAPGSG